MNNNADQCFICGQGNAHTLEEHHVVPRRHNGSDTEENLFHLCGSCHNAVTRMYDQTFYERLGIATKNEDLIEHSDTTGEVVDPEESKGREIPPYSDHIEYEKWTAYITIQDVALANKGEYNGKYKEFIANNAGKILTQYGQELREMQQSITDHLANNDDAQREDLEYGIHPWIGFEFDHDELQTVPVIKVNNKNLAATNGDSPKKEKGNTHTKQMESEHLTQEKYPAHYRLHCGYCHTVFTQHQHTDLARHLRVKHGIEVFSEEQPIPFGEVDADV